jgi:hypothetical protein
VFQTETAAQEQIARGVSNAAHGSFAYNNINFTIFRDLLPYLEGQPDPGPACSAIRSWATRALPGS